MPHPRGRAGRSRPRRAPARLLHPAVDEHRVDGCGTPVVDDGRDVGCAQPHGALVEPDQHQITPSLHWNVDRTGQPPGRGSTATTACRCDPVDRRATAFDAREWKAIWRSRMGELTTDSTPGGSTPATAAPTAAGVAHAPATTRSEAPSASRSLSGTGTGGRRDPRVRSWSGSSSPVTPCRWSWSSGMTWLASASRSSTSSTPLRRTRRRGSSGSAVCSRRCRGARWSWSGRARPRPDV
jgi:hypothetical protein